MNKFANNECALHQIESGRGGEYRIRRVYLQNVRGRAFDLFRRRLKMTHAARPIFIFLSLYIDFRRSPRIYTSYHIAKCPFQRRARTRILALSSTLLPRFAIKIIHSKIQRETFIQGVSNIKILYRSLNLSFRNFVIEKGDNDCSNEIIRIYIFIYTFEILKFFRMDLIDNRWGFERDETRFSLPF